MKQGTIPNQETIKLLGFKGYKYNILNEIQLGHLIALPHMYARTFQVSQAPITPQSANDNSANSAGANIPQSLEELRAELGALLKPERDLVELSVPHQEASVMARLHSVGQVLERSYDGPAARFKARIPPHLRWEFARFIVADPNGQPR